MPFWYYPNKQFERGNLGGVRWSQIEGILCKWEPPCPVSLLFIAEDPQIGFNCLFGSFRLPICLGVISGANVLLDS